MSQYNEHDIKAIINRAAELQQRSAGPDSVDRSSGKLSLGEIEEIAKEAGVSPDYVREAALEYEGIPVEEPLFLDTGTNHEIEIIGFARGDFNKKTWAEMRSIIEYHFDCPGKVVRRPNGIVWEAQPKGIMKYLASRKSPEVEVKSERNRTSIRIKKSIKTTQKLYIPALLSVGIALFFLFMMMVEEEAPLIFGTLIFGGIAELMRRWVKRSIRKARNDMGTLVQNLQTIIARRFKASMRNETSPQIESPGEEDYLDADHGKGDGEQRISKNNRKRNQS